MKKVGIVSLYYKSENYGGLLQAFALTQVIQKMGFECEQIQVRGRETATAKLKIVQEHLKKSGFVSTALYVFDYIVLQQGLKKIVFRVRKNEFQERREVFRGFREEKIKHSEAVYGEETIQDTVPIYDAFVCGSDQIWNPGFQPLSPYIFRLNFVQSEKGKIAYAASAGIDGFDREEISEMKESLKSYKGISVREEALKKNLESFLQEKKKVELVADPTLLFTRNDWSEVIGPRYLEGDYIFTYFMGNSFWQRRFVTKFAKAKGLKIVTLPYLQPDFKYNDLGFGDIRLYGVSPENWINLIKHAKWVFTDSFHCALFSGLYHRRFFLFKRSKDGTAENMNSRIYTLMSIFGTPHRVIDERISLREFRQVKPIDFTTLDQNVEKLRADSFLFLKEMLPL